MTVGVGATILGLAVANFPPVALTCGHLYALGPFDTPADQPGGTILAVLSTITAVTVALIRQSGAY